MSELIIDHPLMSKENNNESMDAELHKKTIINTHIEKTCEVIIQHLKNIILFQSQVNQCWGYHSRFMEPLLHPEDRLIYKGISKNLFDNKELVRRKEHIVPMGFLLNELWELIKEAQYTDQELVKILKRNLGIAYITQDEAKRLDGKVSGLKSSMPEGWRLEEDDPIDRLRAVGIILVDDHGNEVATLKD